MYHHTDVVPAISDCTGLSRDFTDKIHLFSRMQMAVLQHQKESKLKVKLHQALDMACDHDQL